MCTTSRTHIVFVLQPQTVYVSRPISGVHTLLYSVEDITIVWFPTSQLSSHSYSSHYPYAQPLPRMTSSHIMCVHEDNIKHIYSYFKPAK